MLQIIGPAFAMAISGLAQETLNYGTISGVVTDPSGAVIDGAAITARQTEINLTAQATTDAEGRFRLRYLRVAPITAGANTIQGTAARPISNGAYISRNAGTGFDFLNLNVRVSRSFPIRERVRLEGIVEAFNLLNHTNGVTLNGTFGSGAYPTNPLPTFKQITAVGDPRPLQLAVRLSF
jgi:carboxypeptidase family protein